jgi:hypothetical protein
MKTKSLKHFVNVPKDMTGTFFKSEEGMSNRYELVTDWNVGTDIKTKMQKRSCSNPFYASDWMPYTVNIRRKGKPCTDE